MHHERKKHIDIMIHVICNIATRGDVSVEYIVTLDKPAYMIKTSLPSVKFKHCLDLIGIANIDWY